MSKINKVFFLRTNREQYFPYQGYLGELENTLAAEQLYVNYGEPGGKIETVDLSENLVLICNREGRQLGYPPNRVLIDEDGVIHDIFFGNALVVKYEGNEFVSITPEDIALIERCLPPVKVLSQVPVKELPEYKEENRCQSLSTR